MVVIVANSNFIIVIVGTLNETFSGPSRTGKSTRYVLQRADTAMEEAVFFFYPA